MSDARLTVLPDDSGIAVARRVLRAVAATTDLTVDRLEDAVLICDIVLGAIRDSSHTTISIRSDDDGVALTFALREDEANRVHGDSDGLAALITRLANAVWVEAADVPDVALHVLVQPR